MGWVSKPCGRWHTSHISENHKIMEKYGLESKDNPILILCDRQGNFPLD